MKLRSEVEDQFRLSDGLDLLLELAAPMRKKDATTPMTATITLAKKAPWKPATSASAWLATAGHGVSVRGRDVER